MLAGMFTALEIGLFLLHTDRSEKRLKVGKEIIICDSKIPVEEEEELPFHEVHFSNGKAKTLETFHRRIPSPVLVFWGAVIQVFGRKDERGEENAMHGTTHPFGDWR